MKVLLVEALDQTHGVVETRYPALQLAYLAAYAKARLPIEVRIVRGGPDEIASIAADFEPHVVGITCVSQSFSVACAVAKTVKEWRRVPVFVGGHHVSALPESMSSHFDATVIGEGEQTFADLLTLVAAQKTIEPQDLLDIPGLAIRGDDGAVRFSASRPPIANLDDIPLPARDLVELNRADVHMFSSRGCPYKCSFCSSAHFWRTVRYHSENRVVLEILALSLRHGAKSINVFDDLFAIKKSRLAFIANALDAHPRFSSSRPSFACLARADALTPEILQLLKRMGVTGIALGFESGSSRVLKSIKGPSASVEANLLAADMIRSFGIPVVGSVIVGVPGETQEDAHATLDMLGNLGLAAGDAYLAAPYPGTQFWRAAVLQGAVSTQMEWRRISLDFLRGKDYPVIINDKMSRDEIFDYWNAANRILHRDWVS